MMTVREYNSIHVTSRRKKCYASLPHAPQIYSAYGNTLISGRRGGGRRVKKVLICHPSPSIPISGLNHGLLSSPGFWYFRLSKYGGFDTSPFKFRDPVFALLDPYKGLCRTVPKVSKTALFVISGLSFDPLQIPVANTVIDKKTVSPLSLFHTMLLEKTHYELGDPHSSWHFLLPACSVWGAYFLHMGDANLKCTTIIIWDLEA